MGYSDVQLSTEDVERSQWQETIASASPKDVSHYASLFFAESDVAQARDDTALAAFFSLLGTLASLMLHSEKTKIKRPFAPVAVWADGTTSPTLD
ncbi:MAG TPA: hypothetical protein VGR57_17215, partial [Ktedonobacterales bacterium]|nr:hypothetical protein [Ktedonobacterales bacterium]